MIEDALWITILVIDRHQQECPDIYQHMKDDLDTLKQQMKNVLKRMDPKCIESL